MTKPQERGWLGASLGLRPRMASGRLLRLSAEVLLVLDDDGLELFLGFEFGRHLFGLIGRGI
jgi:hypothetical protein